MMSKGAAREKLKKFPGLRSSYYLWLVGRQLLADDWRTPSFFNQLFLAQPDPWSSDHPLEHERVEITLGMLDRAGPSGYPAALEVGCAEGIFTDIVASRCGHLLAVDYSPVGLDRARIRAGKKPNVEFAQLDLRPDRIERSYDLVMAMGVLTYLVRPWDVRRACDKLINAVRPGGVLFFSDARQSRIFESAWWGPVMLRGGDQIRRWLARHPLLELESQADTDAHVFGLFRRRARA